MNSAQKLDISDAFSIEGLDDDVFAATDAEIRSITCADEPAHDQASTGRRLVIKGTLPPAKDSGVSSQQQVMVVPQAEALPSVPVESPAVESPPVARTDLVKILEGFVALIKSGDDGNAVAATNQLTFEPRSTSVATVAVNDPEAEAAELRALLMEAQSTIITLLTDRVEDRARIATLETQLNLLPDLQAQADRALAAAISAGELRGELTVIQQELSKVRTSKVRSDVGNPERSLLVRLKCWLFKQETNRIS